MRICSYSSSLLQIIQSTHFLNTLVESYFLKGVFAVLEPTLFLRYVSERAVKLFSYQAGQILLALLRASVSSG